MPLPFFKYHGVQLWMPSGTHQGFAQGGRSVGVPGNPLSKTKKFFWFGSLFLRRGPILTVWLNSFSVMEWDVGKKLCLIGVRCRKKDAELWIRVYRYSYGEIISGDELIWNHLDSGPKDLSCEHSKKKDHFLLFFLDTVKRYGVANWPVIWKW